MPIALDWYAFDCDNIEKENVLKFQSISCRLFNTLKIMERIRWKICHCPILTISQKIKQVLSFELEKNLRFCPFQCRCFAEWKNQAFFDPLHFPSMILHTSNWCNRLFSIIWYSLLHLYFTFFSGHSKWTQFSLNCLKKKLHIRNYLLPEFNGNA